MGNLALLKKLTSISTNNTTKHSKDNKSRKSNVSGIIRPITKADINNGKKYKDQLRQLHITVGNNKTMRALSDWALNFFDDEPSIKDIAKAVSSKVDKTLYATNRKSEHLQSLSIADIQNIDIDFKIPYTDIRIQSPASYRALMEYQSKFMEKTTSPWVITYRMPKILSSALISTKSRVGKCEEHSFLSLYLLNVGHMIQNMPYGQLKNDIFYTGAAVKGHAMAILVKGSEFKKTILKAKKETKGNSGSEISRILNWMLLNSDKWGKNAWVVDGWNTSKVSTLASKKSKLTFHYGITNKTFKRAFTDNKLSKWDLTIRQMIYRVAKQHGIDISNQP